MTEQHEHLHTHPGAPLPHSHGHDHAHDAPLTPTGDGTIAISHLHFRYPDGTEALRGMDLAITGGEKVALLGQNGAGKSTLMLHLNGIHRPTHGTVHVAGMQVSNETIGRVRAEVGLVFQDPDDQLFSPTVWDDVAFGPTHMGLTPGAIHDRVEVALANWSNHYRSRY